MTGVEWPAQLSLRGKTAVVTGAASGIGMAVARRLAEAGAAVICADRDQAGAEAIARDIDAAGGFARAMLQVIPAPNLGTQENNYTGSARNIENMSVPFFRIDHHFNERQQVATMVRFNYNERNNFNGPWAQRLEGYHDKPESPHVAVNHDWIVRPNLLN